MAFSHDGALLAVGSAMGMLRLCKENCDLIVDFRPVRAVSEHSGKILSHFHASFICMPPAETVQPALGALPASESASKQVKSD